jgi:ribosomal protein S18 acetylase RimI-like enzyme
MDGIIIKRLTPALIDDYLNFFDNTAFTDNPHWSSCYCRCYHFDHDNCDWNQTTAEENRAAVIELIKNGKMNGYLAYDNDRPIGWLNSNHRNNYSVISYDDVDESENAGSIICFIIAKEYRRKGIARLLLDTAIEEFKQQGLDFVEGYPVIDVVGDDKNYHGPLSLYYSAGFEEYDRDDRGDVTVLIVRKKLIE